MNSQTDKDDLMKKGGSQIDEEMNMVADGINEEAAAQLDKEPTDANQIEEETAQIDVETAQVDVETTTETAAETDQMDEEGSKKSLLYYQAAATRKQQQLRQLRKDGSRSDEEMEEGATKDGDQEDDGTGGSRDYAEMEMTKDGGQIDPEMDTKKAGRDELLATQANTLSWTNVSVSYKTNKGFCCSIFNKNQTANHEEMSSSSVDNDENMATTPRNQNHELNSLSNNTNNNNDNEILRNLRGSIRSGEIACVLGPSGAGKTTFFNLLTGHRGSLSGGKIKIRGNFYLNGERFFPSSMEHRRRCGYAMDGDPIDEMATPRETVYFSAKLRLPGDTSDADVNATVNQILNVLNLQRVANNIIGRGAGLSAGERRRVSLAKELVVSPSIIVLDEVTSGLDSHNAYTVMRACRRLADEGAMVIVSMHQPSARLMEMVDNLFVLSHGSFLYSGSPSDLGSFLQNHDLAVPSSYHPAEWIIDVALERPSFVFEQGEEEMDDFEEGDALLLQSPNTGKIDLATIQKNTRVRVPIFTEFAILLLRDLRRNFRNLTLVAIRVGTTLFGAVLMTVVFQDVGENALEDEGSVRSHLGALFTIMLGQVMFLQLLHADIRTERAIFVREFNTDHFRMLSYGTARMAFENIMIFVMMIIPPPILYFGIGLRGTYMETLAIFLLFPAVSVALGAFIASTLKNADSLRDLNPVVSLVQWILCGYVVAKDDMPKWLQPVTKYSPLTPSYRVLVASEFSECLEFSDRLTYCTESFASAARDIPVNELIEELYNDTNIIRGLLFATGGNFIGDICEVPDTADVELLVDDGLCKATRSSIVRQRIAPEMLTSESENEEESSSVEYVFGFHLHYAPGQNISTSGVYVPPSYPEEIVGSLDPQKVVADICRTMFTVCGETAAFNGFRNRTHCRSHMLQLPLLSTGRNGKGIMDQNTTACRFLVHADMMITPRSRRNATCPHLSFFPQADASGRFKCSDVESNFVAADSVEQEDEFGDPFSSTELDLFRKTAQEHGLDSDTQVKMGLRLAEEVGGLCRARIPVNATNDVTDNATETVMLNAAPTTNATREVRNAAFGLAQNVQTRLFCSQQLESLDITPGKTHDYWLTLLTMYAVLRIGAVVFLRQQMVWQR